jgi:RimJ/RimL family protein N-acetyltransferase
MILLSPDQVAAIKTWFLPDRPGALLSLHALTTGLGRFYADCWPEPRAFLVETTGNYSLQGDPNVLSPHDLIDRITGVLDAPLSFRPLLQESFPEMKIWDRIIFSLEKKADLPSTPSCIFSLRRLTRDDAHSLANMSEEVTWISKTWGGSEGLVGSGYAWAVFDGQKILSVACSFFVGETYEDIGVVTEPAYRRLGLSAACSYALCQDIFARGRRGSWSTSTDNVASQGVAEKLGFQFQRYDHLYVINQAIPG